MRVFSILLTLCSLIMGAVPQYTKMIQVRVNHASVASTMTAFPYQIDLSSLLSSNTAFKAAIAQEGDVTVYDPSTDGLCPRIVKLDLNNNKLLIYWDGATSSTVDKTFYVLTKIGTGAVNSSQAFSNSGFTHAWPFDEFSAGASTVDIVGSNNGTLSGTITNGNTGVMGNSIKGTGGVGRCNLGSIDESGNVTISFIFKSTGTYATINRLLYDSKLSVGIRETGNTIVVTRNNFANYLNTGTFTTDTWHHFFAILPTSSATNTKLYIDGVKMVDAAGLAYTAGSVTLFAMSADGSNAINGNMDNLCIANGSVLAPEVGITQNNMLMSPQTFFTVTVKNTNTSSGAYKSAYKTGAFKSAFR